MAEDHTTSFCIMPSLMDEEADNFGTIVLGCCLCG